LVSIVRIVLVGGFAALMVFASKEPAFAQITGSFNQVGVATTPSARDAAPSAEDEPPPGGCMPIGVTSSGDVVFPFLCKNFIEQHKASGDRPAAAAKPAAAETPAELETPATEGISRKAADAGKRDSAPPVENPAVVETPATEGVSRISGTADKKGPAPAGGKDNLLGKHQVARPPAAAPQTAPATATTKLADKRKNGPPGCRSFRTFNPQTSTYRDGEGLSRSCKQ
jgi:hypothetical protein